MIQYTQSRGSGSGQSWSKLSSLLFQWTSCFWSTLRGRRSILLRNLTMMSLFLKFMREDLRNYLMKQLDRQNCWQYLRILSLAYLNAPDYSLVGFNSKLVLRMALLVLSLRQLKVPKNKQMMDAKEGAMREQLLTSSSSVGESQLVAPRLWRCERVNVLMLILSSLVSLLSPFSIFMYFQSMWLDVVMMRFGLSQTQYIIQQSLLHTMNYQLDSQDIIQMVTITYSSTNSQQVQNVQSILVDYIFKDYSRSIVQLENIIAKEKGNIHNNCKKAIINLIKVAVKQIIQSLSLLNKSDDDVVGKHKKLLFTVEHIFDNKQIDADLKVPIGELYVELFVFLTPQNYPRLLSKSKYYFNIKEQILALILTEAYIDKKTPLKYRLPFCEQTLQIILTNCEKKVQAIIASQTQLSQNTNLVINKFLTVIKDLWAKMTFQKFQNLFHKLFSSNQFLNMIKGLSHRVFDDKWKGQINTILNIITFSLGRCSLFTKYPQLARLIENATLREFDKLMRGELTNQRRENEIASLSLIASAIEYRLVRIQIESIDFYKMLIYPTYILIERYLEDQAHNLPQIIHFLDDASFYLQSQTPQTLRHKIIVNLCRNNQSILLSLKLLIQSFYIWHSIQIGNENNKSGYLGQKLRDWQKIEQQLGTEGHLQVILLYSALGVSLFVSELGFMNVVQRFICLNEQWLLQNSNKKIVFYTLAIYKNYMDDIFSSTPTISLRQRILVLALDQSHNELVCRFGLETIREKLSQKPPYQQFSCEIEMLLQRMASQYKLDLMPIMLIIFQQYGHYIKQQLAVIIIKESLRSCQQQPTQSFQTNSLQLCKLFYSIESCRTHFVFLTQQILRIANQNTPFIQTHIQQFIDLMGKALQTCTCLPSNFQPTIIRFEVRVENITTMQNMNKFIQYSNDCAFVNWAAFTLGKNNLNIFQILLIHNLIYYGHKWLSEESVRVMISQAYVQRIHRQNCFDYRNGKLSLIFLFLFKYMWNQTNKILLNSDWNQTIIRGQQLLMRAQRLGGNNRMVGKPFIEEVYDLIYLQQNIYRWKYDIQMFIIHQLDLFKYQIKDYYQFMYANLSFIAASMNILRANDFIQNPSREDGSQSDDSLHPHSKLQKEYREVQHIVERFEVPTHLREVDYFTTYRKMLANLKKDENSNKWVQTIFKAIFQKDERESLQNVMKMHKNRQGKYRKINRILRIRQEHD